MGKRLKWADLRRTCDMMIDKCGGGVRESMVKEFRERARGFVIAPVDKYNQEMAIM